MNFFEGILLEFVGFLFVLFVKPSKMGIYFL